MALITPGSGTLKSATAEDQLLELATYIKNLEQQPSKNPSATNKITITHNLTSLQATITFSLPAKPGINNLGQPITTADNYLQNTGFTNDGSGTFKSDKPENYFLELITYLQIKEADTTKNIDGSNNVTASYDSDENLFSGSVSLPIDVALQSDGSTKIQASEYLRD